MQDRTIFGGVRAQKNPKIGHFIDAPSPRKHLKFHNFTVTNATMIIDLHETFHLA